jgi:hypothetical protein
MDTQTSGVSPMRQASLSRSDLPTDATPEEQIRAMETPEEPMETTEEPVETPGPQSTAMDMGVAQSSSAPPLADIDVPSGSMDPKSTTPPVRGSRGKGTLITDFRRTPEVIIRSQLPRATRPRGPEGDLIARGFRAVNLNLEGGGSAVTFQNLAAWASGDKAKSSRLEGGGRENGAAAMVIVVAAALVFAVA